MLTTRRTIILGMLASAGLAFGASDALAVDTAVLHAPPAQGDMMLGLDNAKVTVVEYASAACSHCAQFHNTTFKDLKKEYIDTGKVRFIFREFPLDQPSLAAFMLARCAPKDKYFPMMDKFFEQQNSWLETPLEGLQKIAGSEGVGQEAFDACLKNEALAKEIIAVSEKASKEFGVNATPTFFVNGEPVRGSQTIEEFRGKLDPLLK